MCCQKYGIYEIDTSNYQELIFTSLVIYFQKVKLRTNTYRSHKLFYNNGFRDDLTKGLSCNNVQSDGLFQFTKNSKMVLEKRPLIRD